MSNDNFRTRLIAVVEHKLGLDPSLVDYDSLPEVIEDYLDERARFLQERQAAHAVLDEISSLIGCPRDPDAPQYYLHEALPTIVQNWKAAAQDGVALRLEKVKEEWHRNAE